MESKFKKIGTLKVKNGTYEKDGQEKSRWNEIGVVFATPHHSRMSVKFHNSATGEGQWASIFYDEDQSPSKPMTQAQALNSGKDVVLEDIDDKPISLDEIPF